MKRLREIVNKATIPLESRLATADAAHRLEPDLQLRSSQCGLATAVLQLYLREIDGIETKRLLAEPQRAPRGINSRRLGHVVLSCENTTIDPTYSQFLIYVGLAVASVSEHESLRQLYPKTKIACIDQSNTDQFADDFAEYAHKIEPVVKNIRGSETRYTPEDALTETSLNEKKTVFRDIWSPKNYRLHPLDNQPVIQECAVEALRSVIGDFS